MSYVRQMMEGRAGVCRCAVAEDGRAGLEWALILPEQYGGSGLSLIDMVVVLEEMGRVVLPGPFFLDGRAGRRCHCRGGQRGAETAAVAPASPRASSRQAWPSLEDNARWDAEGVRLRAEQLGSGYRLSGVKLFVPDAHVADMIVCAARTAEGLGLFLIDRQQAGVSISLLKTMDQTRKLCELRLDKVELGPDALLGSPRTGLGTGSAKHWIAARSPCVPRWSAAPSTSLDMSVEYAKIREQFGRPIGSFQAIQHKCADMLVQVESAKSATYYAAWAVSNAAPDAALASAMAKAYCSDAYRKVSADGIQVHGGIGFTWEHDLHIYFKRAKGSEVTFGDATWNRELVAQHTLD